MIEENQQQLLIFNRGKLVIARIKGEKQAFSTTKGYMVRLALRRVPFLYLRPYDPKKAKELNEGENLPIHDSEIVDAKKDTLNWNLGE